MYREKELTAAAGQEPIGIVGSPNYSKLAYLDFRYFDSYVQPFQNVDKGVV